MTRPRDEAASVEILERKTLFKAFRRVDGVTFRLTLEDGRKTNPIQREVLVIGDVAGCLPYDPRRDAFVLLKQFRAGAHLANGRGELVEIVAGLLDEGEEAAETARRETREEVGLHVEALMPMLSFLPSPGFSSEFATLFLGRVDSSKAAEKGGADGEEEHIRPFVIQADEAIAALDAGDLLNGYTAMALSWFARHRARIAEEWGRP
jgi:ADP-ribose pyrophosphatase